mmetsp:Transcript_61693/g.178952  ORF Transcript_61693/g.178952 Transcript_61693/m.178952 type:complete len:134 (-) Transcript_61693:265-666(-)
MAPITETPCATTCAWAILASLAMHEGEQSRVIGASRGGTGHATGRPAAAAGPATPRLRPAQDPYPVPPMVLPGLREIGECELGEGVICEDSDWENIMESEPSVSAEDCASVSPLLVRAAEQAAMAHVAAGKVA